MVVTQPTVVDTSVKLTVGLASQLSVTADGFILGKPVVSAEALQLLFWAIRVSAGLVNVGAVVSLMVIV